MHIQVIETIAGDINGDRKVDMKEIAIVARAFGTYPGHPLGSEPSTGSFGCEQLHKPKQATVNKTRKIARERTITQS